MTTLSIYVMGLAMLVSSSDGRDLEILLPQAPPSGVYEHHAVMIFPCDDPNGCESAPHEVKDVFTALNLYDTNSEKPDEKRLVFDNHYFGAVLLKDRRVAFSGQPYIDKPAAHARPVRPWYLRWWFQMVGEVPSSTDKEDSTWAVSLPAVASCATRTPADGQKLFENRGLAGFLHITVPQTSPPIPVRAKHEAVAFECPNCMCDPTCTCQQKEAYVPTVSFGMKYWPFGNPNQATADLLEIEIELDPSTKIDLETPDGSKIWVSLDLSANRQILIGNLMPIDQQHPYPTSCTMSHFEMYSEVLDPTCKLPREPHFSFMRRVKEADIGQLNSELPDVVKVVSFDAAHPPRPAYKDTKFQGLARPICYVSTN